MNAFLTKIRELLRCPKELPVETALCITFFCIAVCDTATSHWDKISGRTLSAVNGDILWFFVPLFVLTFYLHRVNKWVYALSFFLFLPLMAFDLSSFIESVAFGCTYILAAILLVVGTRRMDNRPFASHLLHVVTQLFFGFLVAGLLCLAILAIVGSFLYIFGIDPPKHLVEYILQFIWFVVAPLASASFISRDEYAENSLPKVLQLILNFILTPAIILYTVILYAYFIKIALAWDLPKGGVAYMVMAFIAASLAGYLTQYMLPQRHYDWFYRHFTWIALPPLIMFWVGSLYRISLYSFTEGRFYLLVAGVLMTLFVLMLLWRSTRKFQWMVVIFGFALVIFTYIPGISAKSVGIRCQKTRLEQMTHRLHLTNRQTGKFLKIKDPRRIATDSLLSVQYLEVDDVVHYLRNAMGEKCFEEQYGTWDIDIYEIRYSNSLHDGYHLVERTEPIDLGEYRILLNADDYSIDAPDSIINLDNRRRKTVLTAKKGKGTDADDPNLFVYRNDSLLLVLNEVWVDSTYQVNQINHQFQLFKK